MTTTVAPWTLVRSTLVAIGVVALLVVGLPALSGVGWATTATRLAGLGAGTLALLATVWLAGLGVHTITLTAALPGLTHRRALLLSLSGSAVANVFPVGGAVGIWANATMARVWGHRPVDVATYTLVTNVWDVLVKLLLPGVALALLLLTGTATAVLPHAALVGVAIVLVVALATLTLLASARASERAAAVLDVVGARVRPANPPSWGTAALAVRRRSASLVARAWGRLTLGMVGYTALLGLLLWGCAQAAGLGLAWPSLLAVFAVERLLTLAGLTPGGAGVVEVGTTAALLALGVDPVAATTTVVLYRCFTYLLEIPVGGAGLVAWLILRRRDLAAGRTVLA